MFSRSRFGQKSLCTGCGDLFCGLQWEWFKRTPCLLNQVSIAQNLSRICSNGLFFRKFLSQHFRGLSFGFRALHSAQKHFRKLSRTLISPAFANCPELSQAFANKQFAQSFADLSRLHVLLSQRHNINHSSNCYKVKFNVIGCNFNVVGLGEREGWTARPQAAAAAAASCAAQQPGLRPLLGGGT